MEAIERVEGNLGDEMPQIDRSLWQSLSAPPKKKPKTTIAKSGSAPTGRYSGKPKGKGRFT